MTNAVYGEIKDWVGGTDSDGDGYYETYSFKVGVDGDAVGGSTVMYAKMVCPTTNQAWWSSTSWTVTGSETDYHYFIFTEADFAGMITGNTTLDFTVEMWNSTKTTKLADDTGVSGESSLKVDEPGNAVYDEISITDYKLIQNYPNPFNATTTFTYALPKKSNVTFSIIDINGRVVKKLTNENQQPGYYSVKWDASGVSSGVYFYRLNAGEFTEIKKCVLVK